MTKSSANTQQRIIKAACLLFAEHGYDNVTTRDIAKSAKTKPGSIYYYFENKEALYAEVFRNVYDLENALTYEVLLTREPLLLDTPEGKAYAIQRVVFDYFHRHVFTPEEWKRRLILRELFNYSPVFIRFAEDILRDESEKMMKFYFLLSPDGTQQEAYYWSHLPDTQGLYYLMANEAIGRYFDNTFMDKLSRTIIKKTTKHMIQFLGLPVPAMLD